MALARQSGLTPWECQSLMLKALAQPQGARAWLYTHDQDLLSPEQGQGFWEGVQRLHEHVPLAYITQESVFYGLTLRVDDRALDPRSDTETLVDWALEILSRKSEVSAHSHQNAILTKDFNDRMIRSVDLGCGSGAIALALKAHAPNTEVWAVDCSPGALALTGHNAQALRLPLVLREGNWLEGMGSLQFDLIVSNPPYISPGDPHLAALRHEPLNALVSQDGGLADIRRIVSQALAHLKPGGWLLFEHGHDQFERVQASLAQWGYTQIQTRPDLAGIPRCTGAQSPNME
jgi:release factor glutamine methyltransferase